jgi:hypothetical protein
MTQKSIKKRKMPAESIKGNEGVLKKEMLKTANIDAAQEAELSKRLSDMSYKQQAEDMNALWEEGRLMSALWAPYKIPILKQLRKKGVDVDSLSDLLEQRIVAKDSTVNHERLVQKMSEQRTMIHEAISEVVDVKNLERQIRATLTSGRQINLTTDSVVLVLAHKEDE